MIKTITEFLIFNILIAVIFPFSVQAQQLSENTSLAEIDRFITNIRHTNPKIAKEKAEILLDRSKSEKNPYYTLRAYHLIAAIENKQGNFLKGIKYSNLTKKIADSLNNDDYRERSLVIMGNSYSKLGKDNKALKYYLKALTYSKKSKDFRSQVSLLNNIAVLKLNINFKEEALALFKENLTFCKKHNLDKSYEGSLSYTGIVRSFLALQQPDSALAYSNTGLKYATQNNDVEGESYFFLDMGTAYFMKGEFEKSINYLKRAEEITLYLNNKKRIVDIYYYIGKSHAELKDYEEAIQFLEKAKETIAEENSKNKDAHKFSPHILLKVYETLADVYKKQGNIEAANANFEKYNALDKLKDNHRTTVYETLLKNVNDEKKDLISSESNLKEKFKMILWLVGIILVCFSLFIWKHINIRKKNKIIFERLMQKQKEQKIPENKKEVAKANTNIGVPDEIVAELIDKLKIFEENNGYLKQLSIASLAKKLKTNPKYLSKVINNHFQKNFSTYINTLRINYAVKQLKSDTNFSKYSIKAIANEVGFRNVDAFSKAFYKTTGIYPSYFIKQLQKR